MGKSAVLIIGIIVVFIVMFSFLFLEIKNSVKDAESFVIFVILSIISFIAYALIWVN